MKDLIFSYKFYQNGFEDKILDKDMAVIKSVNDFTKEYANLHKLTVISISQPSRFKFIILFKKYINVNNTVEVAFYTMEMKRKIF